MTRSIQEVVIKMGEFYFSSGNVRISTLLGSCVAFTAWHPARRVGGMCHYLLPSGKSSVDPDNHIVGTFADEAIELFETAFRGCGTRASEYVVKMFGGGSMFPIAGPWLDVSARNVYEGKRLFASKGMAVVAEDVGGSGPRRVMLDLWSGDVWVRRLRTDIRFVSE